MASSTIPIGIPSEHPMPQTSFYEYSDYSAFSDSDQFSHLDYSPQYPQTPGSMPSSYHMYPYGGSNGSPPTYGPPSPKAFKRSMSMSGVGPNLDFGNTSPPTPAASTSGSNVGGPTAGGDRAFRQILSQITRIQTNLSQQHFSLMDVAEKQGKIQDKLKMLEARSDSVNDEVTKVLENTDCIVDDVKDMKERVERYAITIFYFILIKMHPHRPSSMRKRIYTQPRRKSNSFSPTSIYSPILSTTPHKIHTYTISIG